MTPRPGTSAAYTQRQGSTKVLPQGVKNMDDFLLYAVTLEDLEQKLIKFMEFAKSKNLKLNPKKFFISEEVEFGGSTVSAEKCENEDLIFISLSKN